MKIFQLALPTVFCVIMGSLSFSAFAAPACKDACSGAWATSCPSIKCQCSAGSPVISCSSSGNTQNSEGQFLCADPC